MALLTAGLLKAADQTATNHLPVQFRNQMDAEGYSIDQTNFDVATADTNSLIRLPRVEKRRFIPLVRPATKPGWSLLNHFNLHYVGNRADQVSLRSPSAALSHYEYDITYSFEF